MIISEKSYQNLSDYIQFLLKKLLEFNKKGIISSEKIRNSDDYVYNYAHSFFRKDFQSKPLYWLVRCRESGDFVFPTPSRHFDIVIPGVYISKTSTAAIG